MGMDITDYRNLDGKLLAVKCLYENGCGHGGYDWSPDDHDIGDKWDNIASCQGTTGAGGFYAWPLGIGIGDGKEPNACHPWIVIEITGPCVMIDQKIKFKSCKVIYRGTMANCMYYTMADRIDFITRNSISMTGDRASSSITGEYCISAMTRASINSIIEVSPTSIAAIIGEEIRWRVRAGALLVQRWEGGHKTLVGKKQHDGKICIVKKGVIVEVNP
jgi:hypothetical protein